jgi:transposase
MARCWLAVGSPGPSRLIHWDHDPGDAPGALGPIGRTWAKSPNGSLADLLIARSQKKTYRHDATALAQFLKVGCLPTVATPAPRIRALRQLFATRETLVRMSAGLKNVGHAALARNGIASRRAEFTTAAGRARLAELPGLGVADRVILDSVLRQLDALTAEVTALEQEIMRVGRDLPGLTRLLQIRGLGLVGAIGVLAEIGDVARFPTAKQLVAYAGLATAVRQSGETEQRGHITKVGRSRLRGFMVEAVLCMVRQRSQHALTELSSESGRRRAPARRPAPQRASCSPSCSSC